MAGLNAACCSLDTTVFDSVLLARHLIAESGSRAMDRSLLYNDGEKRKEKSKEGEKGKKGADHCRR
jgi:hypothetical protein